MKNAVRSAAMLSVLLGPLCGAAVAETGAKMAPAACTPDGEGRIFIDALATCFDSGGYVWAEGYYNSYTNYPSGDDKFYGIGTLGLTLDTTTDLGPLGPLKGVANVRFQYRGAEP